MKREQSVYVCCASAVDRLNTSAIISADNTATLFKIKYGIFQSLDEAEQLRHISADERLKFFAQNIINKIASPHSSGNIPESSAIITTLHADFRPAIPNGRRTPHFGTVYFNAKLQDHCDLGSMILANRDQIAWHMAHCYEAVFSKAYEIMPTSAISILPAPGADYGNHDVPSAAHH